jgi:hypothetical protein
METPVRWSLKVSKETDEALRAHLGRSGGRKGDMSKFVQEAVRARLAAESQTSTKRRNTARSGTREGLARALGEIRRRTGKLSKARFEKLVAEAVAYARRRR